MPRPIIETDGRVTWDGMPIGEVTLYSERHRPKISSIVRDDYDEAVAGKAGEPEEGGHLPCEMCGC